MIERRSIPSALLSAVGWISLVGSLSSSTCAETRADEILKRLKKNDAVFNNIIFSVTKDLGTLEGVFKLPICYLIRFS